jgi:hypothetical protein
VIVAAQKFQAYNLRETYHELGDYRFKIVLHPRYYKSGHDFRVELFDSSNKLMKYVVEIWGRKLNVLFRIDEAVSDGVSYVNIIRGDNQIGRLTFWIIKP